MTQRAVLFAALLSGSVCLLVVMTAVSNATRVSRGPCPAGLDADGDGVCDDVDNCPNHANADQADCDGDGLGDVCAIATGLSADCNNDAIPDSCELEQLAKLTASDTDAGDEFGRSVSMDGAIVVVGSKNDGCAAGSKCGAAYVYRLVATAWSEETKLTASDAARNDEFGGAVAVHGATAVVGARLAACGAGSACGAAYVYRFDLGTSGWVEEAKLTASDAVAGDVLGFSVAINGDTIVASAVGFDCPAGNSCGAAYVFRFDGAQWIEQAKLVASDGAAIDQYGITVAVHGDTIVVGARFDDCAAGNDCGAAYVYRFDGAQWIEETKLTAPVAAAGDEFGWRVAVGAGTIVVGAPKDDCAIGLDCGTAYVYRFNGVGWNLQATLAASDAGAGDQFGRSVSVASDVTDRIVVGSYLDDCTPSGINCGSAYVFRFDGMLWIEESKLTATDAAVSDGFGDSVSISGERAVVGTAGFDCGTGSNCGAAYVFDVGSTDCNGNGVLDECDVADGGSADCNGNGIPDECEGELCDDDNPCTEDTCVIDACDNTILDDGTSCTDNNHFNGAETCLGGLCVNGPDCNANEIIDSWDISTGMSRDCNNNGVPDSCDLGAGTSSDCNNNGILDECDITDGTSTDVNGNGIPDDCEPCINDTDCDDGVTCTVDTCDPLNPDDEGCVFTPDDDLCNDGLFCNGVETCDPVMNCQPGTSPCNAREACNEQTDECGIDCNNNDIFDVCDIDCWPAGETCDVPNCGMSEDCNVNGIPDECEGARLAATNTAFYLELNAVSGSAKRVSAFGLGGFRVEGVAFDPNSNTLYGIDGYAAQLIVIDPASGTATAVGNLGFSYVVGLAFDPNTNTLYGTDVASRQLIVIDPTTGAGTAVGSLADRYVAGLAFDPNTNTLYGVDPIGGKLVVLDPIAGTLTVVGLIGWNGQFQGLAFDPNTNSLYAIDASSDELIVIDPATGAGTVVADLTFLFVAGLTFDPNTGTLYGTDGNSGLIVIDPATGGGTVVGPLEFNYVLGLAFDPNTNTLYGTDVASDRLIVIDPVTGTGTTVGPFGFSDVRRLAFDPNTNTLFGVDGSFNDQLIVIDPTTGAGTAVGAIGFSAVIGLAFDPNTNTLYGTDASRNELITIDPTTGAGTAMAPLGFSAGVGLAFDPNTNTLYGTDGNSDLIVIDPATGAGTAVGTVGLSVGALAFDPNSNVLYGTNPSASGAQLLNIDLATGAGTSVGSLGHRVDALAFDRNTNTLYGLAIAHHDTLIVIDQDTGGASVVGTTGMLIGSGLAFDPNTNTLYATDTQYYQLFVIDPATGAGMAIGNYGDLRVNGLAFDSNTDTLYGIDYYEDQLIVIDPVTGTGTVVGDLGFSSVASLAFDPTTNVLYGTDTASDQLIVIDPTTGAGTAVGPTEYLNIRGLAWIGGGRNDCNGNGILDDCDIANCPLGDAACADCNANNTLDECDLAHRTLTDADGDGYPDECVQCLFDSDCDDGLFCNGSERCDPTKLNAPTGCTPGLPPVCNANQVCHERAGECASDCNGNGIPDACDVKCGAIGGVCDLARCGLSEDCNGNGNPDVCDIADCPPGDAACDDCNANNVPDECDLANGTLTDVDGDGDPDECVNCFIDAQCDDGLFCNGPEQCDPTGLSAPGGCTPGLPPVCKADQVCREDAGECADDCNGNGIPDACDIECGPIGGGCDLAGCGQSEDCNDDGTPDECPGLDWNRAADLVAAGTVAEDLFGTSIAVSGDVAVVGAAKYEVNGSDRGAAYVFRWDGTNWIEEQKLLADDGRGGDAFGLHVAVSGNVVVVGAHANDDLNTTAGAAYVFRYDGKSWVQEQMLLPDDGVYGDWFGFSVAVSGDVAVVGARLDDNNHGVNSGSVYVFRFNGADWVQQGRLEAFDGFGYDEFGYSVAVDGDMIVVGARQHLTGTGSAYGFQWIGGAWRSRGPLLRWDSRTGQYFGQSVSISGNVALVGAENAGNFRRGRAYIFLFDGDYWNLQQMLEPNAEISLDEFGTSLSVVRDVAVVAAVGLDSDENHAVWVHVFRFNGTEWINEQTIPIETGVDYEYARTSVASLRDMALVSIYGNFGNFRVASSAYRLDYRWVDCNDNGIPDECDLTDGTLHDLDGDGVPDECGPCISDTECDDGLFCTGAEFCDPDNPNAPVHGCYSGWPPYCAVDQVCDESADECAEDCNANGIPDGYDIDSGASTDCNGTAEPDECETISGGDFDANGVVELGDWTGFIDCAAGPGAAPSLGFPECEQTCLHAFDFDIDGDVDMKDAAAFGSAFGGVVGP